MYHFLYLYMEFIWGPSPGVILNPSESVAHLYKFYLRIWYKGHLLREYVMATQKKIEWIPIPNLVGMLKLMIPYTDQKGMKALPWWSSNKDSAHPMQGTWVQSLVKELDPTCHMSHVAMKIQCSQINTYKFLKGSMNRFITHWGE